MNKNNSNVFFLINSLGKGGAERQASVICNEIALFKLVLLEKNIAYNLNSIDSCTTLSNKKINKFKQAFRALSFFKKNPAYIILSFLEFSNYINIISKLLGFSQKSIISVRNSLLIHKGYKGKINLFLIKLLYPHADIVTCNSNDLSIELQNTIPSLKKIITIKNIIDDRFYLSPEGRFQDERMLKIITVGRLIESKNHLVLLEILKRLKVSNIPCQLTIIGSGPFFSKIYSKAEELNLKVERRLNHQADIYLLGNLDSPEEVLKESNLFLLSSRVEGLPNSLLEAMASGLPCLSSNCKTGPSEILGPINEIGNLLLPIPTNENLHIWVNRIKKIYIDNEFMLLSKLLYKESLKYKKELILSEWKDLLLSKN